MLCTGNEGEKLFVPLKERRAVAVSVPREKRTEFAPEPLR